MTLELEGNILVERAHTRRWVSIIAVVIPVAAFVMVSAWFIRAYVNPPTIAISSPMMMTAAITPPPPPVRAQVEAPRPEPLAQRFAAAEPVAAPPPVKKTSTQPSALPMFAALAVAPPSFNAAPPAPPAYPAPASTPAPAPTLAETVSRDPAPDASSVTPSIMVEETASIDSSEPIVGPIPLPRAKPHEAVALLASGVPLPRPRPTETAPPSDLPAVDRHAVD
jgi:hypothetical protein